MTCFKAKHVILTKLVPKPSNPKAENHQLQLRKLQHFPPENLHAGDLEQDGVPEGDVIEERGEVNGVAQKCWHDFGRIPLTA